MKRRYKALIAIAIPTLIVTVIRYFYPVSYNILIGYIIAIALIFKSSILSFWLVSKLKLISFLKSLTLFQAILLATKRWFLDNIFSKWLNNYIFRHLKEPFIDMLNYYKRVPFKKKINHLLTIIFPLAIVSWLIYLTDSIYNLAIFVELKVIVIGFFKAVWLIFAKIFDYIPVIFGYLSNSWLSPIIEVFALSWLIDFFEKIFGKNNPISNFFNLVGNSLNRFLEYIGLLKDKHLEPIINNKIIKKSKSVGKIIYDYIKNKKITDEFFYFDNFKNIILKGHINAYYSFKGMEKIFDKQKLYTIINQKTNDNIDIIAFVSRNGRGELIEESFKNDFYHDIFLLKGVASNVEYGVKEDLKDKIDYTDFWILNTSSYPVTIKSINKNFKKQTILGNDMQLIKTKEHINFKDIVFEFNKKEVNPTPI